MYSSIRPIISMALQTIINIILYKISDRIILVRHKYSFLTQKVCQFPFGLHSHNCVFHCVVCHVRKVSQCCSNADSWTNIPYSRSSTKVCFVSKLSPSALKTYPWLKPSYPGSKSSYLGDPKAKLETTCLQTSMFLQRLSQKGRRQELVLKFTKMPNHCDQTYRRRNMTSPRGDSTNSKISAHSTVYKRIRSP